MGHITPKAPPMPERRPPPQKRHMPETRVSPTMPDPFIDRHALPPDAVPAEMSIFEAISRCVGIAGGLLGEAIKTHAMELPPSQRWLIARKFAAWDKAGQDFLQTWDAIVEPERPEDDQPF